MVNVFTLPRLAGLDSEYVRLARLIMNVIGLASKPANRLMKMHDVQAALLANGREEINVADPDWIRIQEGKNYPQK